MKRAGSAFRPYIPDPPRVRKAHDHRANTGDIFKSTVVSVRSGYSTHSHDVAPDGTITDLSSATYAQSQVLGSNTFIGSKNPYWKDAIRNCTSATTAASGSRWDADVKWYSIQTHLRNKNTKQEYNREVYGFNDVSQLNIIPSTSDKTRVDNRAITKFLNRLDSVLSSVELGQDLGEYRETVHGITNPLSSLRNGILGYLSKLTKAKKSYPRHSLPKILADSYLEWTFGWHPLALDIADAIVGLQNRSQHFRHVPIQGGSRDYTSGSNTFSDIPTGDGVGFQNWRLNTQRQTAYTVRYKGMATMKLVNGSLPVNEVLQLDLPHFIPTAWDLLPYSFIVDYFTNAGDVIRAYSARTNQVAWVNKTERTEFINKFGYSSYLTDTALQPVYIMQESRTDGGISSVTQTNFARSAVSAGSLRPSFQFEMPGFGEKPWLNIGALILSRVKPLVPFF